MLFYISYRFNSVIVHACLCVCRIHAQCSFLLGTINSLLEETGLILENVVAWVFIENLYMQD